MSNQRLNPVNIGEKVEFINISILKALPNPPQSTSIQVLGHHKQSDRIVKLAEFPFIYPNIQRYHVGSGDETLRSRYPEILSEQQAVSLATDLIKKLAPDYGGAIPSDKELLAQLNDSQEKVIANPTDNSDTVQKSYIDTVSHRGVTERVEVHKGSSFQTNVSLEMTTADSVSQTDNFPTLYGMRCADKNKFSIKLKQGPHSQHESCVVVDIPYIGEPSVDSDDQLVKKSSTRLTSIQASYIAKIILNHLTSTLKGNIPTDEEIEKLYSRVDAVNSQSTVSAGEQSVYKNKTTPLILTPIQAKIFLAKHHERYVNMCSAISLERMTYRTDLYFHFFPNTQSVLTVSSTGHTEPEYCLTALSDIVCPVDWSELRNSAKIIVALKNMLSFVATKTKKFYTWDQFAAYYLSQTAD